MLAPYTTFKIGGPARYFCEARDQFDTLSAFEFAGKKKLPVFVLGGGSNVLISDSGFKGLVMRVVNSGIEIVSEDGNQATLKVAAGETWDKAVAFAVKNRWWGVENLSHIPGSTGAIAVQNVGAYGQEARDVIESVTVFDTETRQILSLTNEACGFAYRSSIFNGAQKGKYIIFDISFRLQKTGEPNLEYRDLNEKFANLSPTIEEVRQAVIDIRDKKYPFPKEPKNGNAGSFFKNPVLSREDYGKLLGVLSENFEADVAAVLEKKKFVENGHTKVPAAYLVELCGLKDTENGGAAINHNQPLVIINKTGKATAEDVLDLANWVKKTVNEKIGVSLNFEPELIGF